MKTVMSKENVMAFLKKTLGYVIIGGALVIGYTVGRYAESYQSKQVIETNPYSHAFDPEEISIAVNESNELMLVERKTGKYVVYSDKIGMTIFKMYSKRIYQNSLEK